jgi:long-subunit fatty acid transport protein
MKLFISKMFRSLKYLFVVACVTVGFNSSAQTTTSSPYSQYGLGTIKGSFLPQYRAMGSIAVGLRSLGSIYNNINIANPASYSSIQLTTFDVGLSTSLSQLEKGSVSKKSFNGTLSHLVFAIPVNKTSTLSFGLSPYSELGYQFKTSSIVDTTTIDQIYGGEGGISKLHFGYGLNVGKSISVGFNLGYLFGKLKSIRSTEFPKDPSALNSRKQKSNSINGFNLNYGVQYFTAVSPKVMLIVGYSGTAGNKLNSFSNEIVTNYKKNFEFGDETPAIDTVYATEEGASRITMPMSHNIGFSLQGTSKWLFGADFSMTNWSEYREGATNPDLGNSYGVAVGGQITPNINAVSGYYKFVDYRLGYRYNKSYININDTDIIESAITFGFGFPLASNRGSLYKINLSAEIGKRGQLENNLVRERFMNFHLGFLLNDRWFNRNKIE